MKLKKAEQYLEDIKEKYHIGTAWQVTKPYLLEVIKTAQIDAIEETVKLCAENAKIRHDYYDYDTPELYNKYKHEGFERCDGDGVQYGVDVVSIDKNSILNCAEILKKEL